jgi:DNA-directed RNA polymerase beta subunit
MSAAVKAVTTMKDSKAKLYINALERKNAINTLAALRVITTPNKNMAQQSDRAYAMRAVHPTFTGMICPNASVDTGQAVGLNKQLAIATIISSATDSSFVSEILLKDPLVVPLLKMQVELVQQANRVLVNGDTIGYTLDPNGLVLKYRMARRNGENGISRKMTIFWDTYIGKIYFFTDSGRMLRPLIVVKDNLGGGGGTDGTSDLAGVRGSMPRLDVTDLASLAKFRQTMALTKDDVRAITAGKGKFSDLEERGVVEYIDAQEQTNCVIAQDLQTFNAARGDIRRRFTHVQWPQTMLGLAILTAPIPNHSESSRCCYQTNHAKQACGWYALNWPSRIDKLTFFQFACENPLVTTIVNRHVQPNGANVIVAMMSFNGANMEDALIFNKSSALNGLFAGIAFHSEKSELEKDEEWGIPNTATTHEIKQHANYSKLQPSGYPAVGTLIRNGDVVIGKIQHIKQPTTQYTTIDKSVVYKKQEDAVVTCVYKDVNQDNNPFIKVKLETVRTVQNGDKYSSRSGNKGIVSCQLPSCDMPYGEKTGIRPDIIYNAHCMPKRMMINQQLEAVLAYINAKLGRIADQTAFMPIDINWIKKEAARAGIEYLGEERMINGMTGQTQEAMIFMTPLNIQHLKRFIVDSIYVANSGATSAITHQPVSGKKQGGSLKYGEMEKDVIFGHGAISMFCERFFTNSDGVDVPVCKTCGNRAIITGRGTARCTICRDRADIVFISSAWAVNGFLDSLNALGVKMNLTLDPHVIEN